MADVAGQPAAPAGKHMISRAGIPLLRSWQGVGAKQPGCCRYNRRGRMLAFMVLASLHGWACCPALALPETYVPPDRDGAAGVYFDAQPSFAQRAVAASRRLSCWDEWYRAPWWLKQGDAMTLFAALGRASTSVEYARKLVDTLDGGVVALDVVRSAAGVTSPPVDGSSPVVLLVSGLGGGSQGGYVRNMVVTLARQGYAAAVLNMRGCAGAPLRTPRLFSAYRGSTDDVRMAVRYVREILMGGGEVGAQGQVFLLGWSNGATIVANTLAEQALGVGKAHCGAWTSVSGGAALAAPHDMVRSTLNCEERLFSRVVYNRYVARNVVDQITPYAYLYQAGPVARWVDGELAVNVDVELLLGATRIRDIDEAVTRRVFGYRSTDEYYRDASSFTRLEKVAVPLLLLSAADDPVATGWAAFARVRQNPWVVLAYTEHGGHLGWQDEADPRRSEWVERVVSDFFDFARHNERHTR